MQNESGLKLIFWIGTLTMLGLTFMVLLLTILYQKKVHKIKQQEAENLLKASLESEKNERKRIASDLHDGVLGDLNAIRNFMTILYQQKENTNKAFINEVKSSLDETLDNIRAISYNLMPPMLEDFGLLPALQEHVARLEKWHHIKINISSVPSQLELSSTCNYELYRIFQELFSNMIKYGKVENASISFLKKNDTLTIIIVDDGIPFDFFKRLKESKGMGLRNIISRIKYINGKLVQESFGKKNKLTIRLNA